MTGKRVEFSVIRQEYSSYRVENGQILKYMPTVIDIHVSIDGGSTGQISVENVVRVISPPDMTRDDMNAPTGSAAEKRVAKMKFNAEAEVINIYETEHHIILLSGAVQRVFLTNKVDSQNNPHLQFESEMALNVVPKPTYV